MTYTTIYNDPYSRAKYIEPWVYWDDAFTEQELDKIVSYCESFELGYGTTFGTSDKQSAENIGGRVSNVMFHERNQEISVFVYCTLLLVDFHSFLCIPSLLHPYIESLMVCHRGLGPQHT